MTKIGLSKEQIKALIRQIEALKAYSDKQNLNLQSAFDWINEGRSDAYQDCINLLTEMLLD